MSLFGTSPEDSSGTGFGQGRSSLFSDESGTGANASSSLFADDDFGSKSLWSSSNTKRAARHKLVKTLLADTDVPDSYIDTYDLVLSAGNGVGSGIGLTAVREILAGSGLNATDQAKILNLIVPSESSHSDNLGRPEFNVLLALIGLAREGEDITFDAVDERRKNLPEPKSSYFDRLRANDGSAPSQERPTTPSTRADPVQEPSSDQSRFSRRDSMGGLESDPWGSPQRTRDGAGPALNGYGSMRSTMNAWSSRLPEENNESEVPNGHVAGNVTAGTVSSTVDSGWGDYSNTSTSAFEAPDRTGFGGFGPPGDDQGDSTSQAQPLGTGRTTGPQPVEEIKVTLLPEKEGVFLFQHRNYEVKWTRRGSTVVRRYSDFVWLLDCLHKRYPFRQLPLLPPKRVSVNGTHLAADSNSFLEKRRRGLVRFVNALARHPVLSQEQLVVMFLTVPTELSVWRKQATVSVQDEFTGRVLPPELEDSLPSNLSDTLDTVRNGVKRSAEIYINLCMLLERLSKRNEGLAADNLRFSLALQSLTEVTRDTYAIDTNDVPMLNEGISCTAKHLATSQTLLEDEAQAWNEGVLEDLKLQRDWLVSMRELFDRRDRYAKNNIPQLERRIENNEKKLQDLRARPEGTVKPGDIEKVEEAIFKAKESIVQQHARGVFIKECMLQELIYFQQSQYQISHLHQDWSQERVKYAELQADNWRRLADAVEGMPTGSE
ncbi:Sorting nexin mvp1 [Monascus purpureus]|uniref:Sorting nexin MVP1 n=1 Tax=Monascus purpureus TaxID=5098 RepID=A0A507QL09_MONPU|nr:Sorting nexin mvp1 [Monascus purpureus]